VQAVRLMSMAMQSSTEVSGAAHVPKQGTYLRIEGISASVAYRRAALLKSVGNAAQVLPETKSVTVWRTIRDVAAILDYSNAAIWRLSITPSHAPQFLSVLRQHLDFRYYLDWAGGLVWLSVPGPINGEAIRSHMASGHATLMRAPDSVRTRVNVFHPQSPALAALSLRVKHSFDPDRRLNPGRMYEDV
jgi:glycolate oxidase FAD binding subunit